MPGSANGLLISYVEAWWSKTWPLFGSRYVTLRYVVYVNILKRWIIYSTAFLFTCCTCFNLFISKYTNNKLYFWSYSTAMSSVISVLPETFNGIHNVDIDRLSALPESALRPILPCLVRMSLCAPLDSSARWTLERKKILKCLSGVEVVNNLVGLLSIDFHELEQDARKELQMRLVLRGSVEIPHRLHRSVCAIKLCWK